MSGSSTSVDETPPPPLPAPTARRRTLSPSFAMTSDESNTGNSTGYRPRVLNPNAAEFRPTSTTGHFAAAGHQEASSCPWLQHNGVTHVMDGPPCTSLSDESGGAPMQPHYPMNQWMRRARYEIMTGRSHEALPSNAETVTERENRRDANVSGEDNEESLARSESPEEEQEEALVAAVNNESAAINMVGLVIEDVAEAAQPHNVSDDDVDDSSSSTGSVPPLIYGNVNNSSSSSDESSSRGSLPRLLSYHTGSSDDDIMPGLISRNRTDDEDDDGDDDSIPGLVSRGPRPRPIPGRRHSGDDRSVPAHVSSQFNSDGIPALVSRNRSVDDDDDDDDNIPDLIAHLAGLSNDSDDDSSIPDLPGLIGESDDENDYMEIYWRHQRLSEEQVLELPEIEYKEKEEEAAVTTEIAAPPIAPIKSNYYSVLLADEDEESSNDAVDEEGECNEEEIENEEEQQEDDKAEEVTTCHNTSCAICLEDFEIGEKLRLLPRCGHAFHTEHISSWLTGGRACCPLCKTKVLERDNTSGSETDSDLPDLEDAGPFMQAAMMRRTLLVHFASDRLGSPSIFSRERSHRDSFESMMMRMRPRSISPLRSPFFMMREAFQDRRPRESRTDYGPPADEAENASSALMPSVGLVSAVENNDNNSNNDDDAPLNNNSANVENPNDAPPAPRLLGPHRPRRMRRIHRSPSTRELDQLTRPRRQEAQTRRPRRQAYQRRV